VRRARRLKPFCIRVPALTPAARSPRSQEQAARASSTEVAADVNLAGKDGKGGFAVDMGKAPAAAMLAGPPTRLLCLDEKAVPALGVRGRAASRPRAAA